MASHRNDSFRSTLASFSLNGVIKIPEDLLGDREHGSQVLVSWSPGVGRRTFGDLRLLLFCQRPQAEEVEDSVHGVLPI
uniref:Uncharacterized protein n=1 Tax=Anguilla anguilla TaxID=7936 RepID=A0A0E9QGA9_ANGAN